MAKEAVIKYTHALIIDARALQLLAFGRQLDAMNKIYSTYGDELSDLDSEDKDAISLAMYTSLTQDEFTQKIIPYLQERYGDGW